MSQLGFLKGDARLVRDGGARRPLPVTDGDGVRSIVMRRGSLVSVLLGGLALYGGQAHAGRSRYGSTRTMLPRNPDTGAFWQAFRRHAGLDHDNYVVGSFGDSPEMATELADLVTTGIKRATASLARW